MWPPEPLVVSCNLSQFQTTTSPGAGVNPSQEAPLAILQRRYARGEIGPDEYERIRSDLLRDGGGQNTDHFSPYGPIGTILEVAVQSPEFCI